MHADHEIGLPSEAQREMRVRRIAADIRIVSLPAPFILRGERIQPVPHGVFERRFVDFVGPGKHHGEAAQTLGVPLVILAPLQQGFMNFDVVPGASQRSGCQDLQPTGRKGRFRSDTGEAVLHDMRP